MQFADIAQDAFSFLKQLGFKLVQRDSERLQYETDQSIVVVEWDTRSGEINVFVGLQPKMSERQDMFSLNDLLNMLNEDAAKRKTPYQVAEENRLAPFLWKLAEDTRVHAQPALAGDRMFFRRLETFRSAQSQAHMRDMKLRGVRSEADKAWKERDFDKMINLYSSIESDLSEAERGKLDYARTHQRR
jgi:hypothetical protein